ncbi:unnamed protein product [Didymodactylos carnosus]|uniref:Alpha-L-glutamate ligase-related protein ATP-grasp domain-containing protein n=1 Tax=Didymodactylos carnosus TaxID=1234261 RepID=A0A813UEG0_9BILA|nr:unnamed protein product [Didymodactylos carnosus]CAF0866598.1 unnamed protein product [Didymodactylos carnosus]CAF3608824.1 unnamed protein product [Didymodactylos carnosus]CAF3651413.1 unnamed protein product [Didymodactylos carnosus]
MNSSLGIPVSPFFKFPSIMIKHKAIEGGMGIHIYRNFAIEENPGDWILQEVFENSAFVKQLIPENAPLSTIRVITASSADKTNSIKALTAVFRAGRPNESTDHNAIFFNIDMKSGLLSSGTTTKHWNKLGLLNFCHIDKTMWNVYRTHPDSGVQIEGVKWPNLSELIKIVCDAHEKMCADVPLIGWDVALTSKGIMLLELNISCNFFNGKLDRRHYTNFCYDWFRVLDSS